MALLTAIRDLHRRKGRERRGLALAEGVRLVEEMLAAGVPCKGVVAAPALDSTPRGVRLRRSLAEHGVAVETVTDADLADLAATEHPQGIVAVYQVREWTAAAIAVTRGRPLVVLDGVQDPGNVGTIARTAQAFRACGLLALPGTADLTNPKTVRGAMGALFTLPHLHADEAALFAVLDRCAVELWATTVDGEAIETAPHERPIALVFGNEGSGIGAAMLARAARRVTIPIDPSAESLNVAVAAGIALYQVTR